MDAAKIRQGIDEDLADFLSCEADVSPRASIERRIPLDEVESSFAVGMGPGDPVINRSGEVGEARRAFGPEAGKVWEPSNRSWDVDLVGPGGRIERKSDLMAISEASYRRAKEIQAYSEEEWEAEKEKIRRERAIRAASNDKSQQALFPPEEEKGESGEVGEIEEAGEPVEAAGEKEIGKESPSPILCVPEGRRERLREYAKGWGVSEETALDMILDQYFATVEIEGSL